MPFFFLKTWRSECDEAWTTRWGHSWSGSGETRGTRGVGILLHSRWTHTLFRPVSERMCMLGVKLTNETVSISSVYCLMQITQTKMWMLFTHSWIQKWPSLKTEKQSLSLLVIGTREWDKHRMMMMINLSVRQFLNTERKRVHNSSNGCNLNGYMIANTFSAVDQMRTYQNGKESASARLHHPIERLGGTLYFLWCIV